MIQLSGPGELRNGAANDYEVLSLAKCKELLTSATGTGDDTVLQSLIDAVHQSAHVFTGGRIFKRNTAPYDQLYHGNADGVLDLRQWPIGTVTSIAEGAVVDSVGSFTASRTYLTTEYFIDKDHGRILPLSIGGWGGVALGRFNIRIVYTAGYASGQVPSDILRALADWVGVSIKRAEKKTWDVSSEGNQQSNKVYTVGEMPRSTEAVLMRYRRLEAFIG